MSLNFALAVFAAFLSIAIVLIIAMFVSLAKQGDERRRMIVEKAGASTFAVTILYLLFQLAENIYKVVSGTDLSPAGVNPFTALTVIAVVYAVSLFYHKKKYGD